jgi:hypothetical protein
MSVVAYTQTVLGPVAPRSIVKWTQPASVVSGVQFESGVLLESRRLPLVSVTKNEYVTNEHAGDCTKTVKSTTPVEL